MTDSPSIGEISIYGKKKRVYKCILEWESDYLKVPEELFQDLRIRELFANNSVYYMFAGYNHKTKDIINNGVNENITLRITKISSAEINENIVKYSLIREDRVVKKRGGVYMFLFPDASARDKVENEINIAKNTESKDNTL